MTVDPQNTRTLEVKNEDGWGAANMAQLEIGDVFRMFEPDGSAVADALGRREWTVTQTPFIPCE